MYKMGTAYSILCTDCLREFNRVRLYSCMQYKVLQIRAVFIIVFCFFELFIRKIKHMKKEWTEKEIEFLKKNYSIYGCEFCANELKRTKSSIRGKVQYFALNLECRNEKYNEIKFRKIVSESKSYTDVVRKLGISTHCGNRNTIKKYIEKYSIDISHFDFGISGSRFVFGKFDLVDILVENSTYSQTTNLKERLYKEGLKQRVCEKCGQGEIWNGEKISLIIDHINGCHNDNRLENLRIVCPNCSATFNTNGGKNRGKKYLDKAKEIREKNKNYCACGIEICKDSKKCKSCEEVRQRKVQRPPYLQLVKEIEKTNYCAVGRKYGVSDNAIRKWVKNYEKKLNMRV